MLSIIIPCLNLEHYITPMLESLKAQTFKDFEVIFALDDCVDHTKDIIETYQSYFSLKICEGKWHRAALGRNAGLDLANGDYVWFMDGDDWLIGQDALEKAMQIVSEHSDADAIKFLNTKSSDCEANVYDHCIWNWVAKRSTLLEYNIRFENLQFYEDTFFSGRLRMLPKVYYCDNKAAFYYYNYPRTGSTRDKLELKSPVYCVLPCIDKSKFIAYATHWTYIETGLYVNNQQELKQLIIDTLKTNKRLLLDAYTWVNDLLFSLGLPVNLILTTEVPSEEETNYKQLMNYAHDIIYFINTTSADDLYERLHQQFFPGSVGIGKVFKDNL